MTSKTHTRRASVIAALAAATMASYIVAAQNQPPPAPGARGQGAPAAAPTPAGGGGRGAGGGWATTRGDAQRTAWVRNDAYISVDNFAKPGFGLEWRVTMGRTAGETLSEGISGNTAQLNPAPGDVAGSANNLYSYELDTGSLVWTRHFDLAASTRTASCPGGITSGVTRNTPLAGGVIGPPLGRGSGAFTGRPGAVGQPGEGVPPEVVMRRGGAAPAAAAVPAPTGATRGGANAARGTPPAGTPAATAPAGPAGGGRGGPAVVHAITSDGLLRHVGLQQGKEVVQPTRFLPAGSHASSIVLVNNVVYATTINGCGGASNGVWAINLGNNNTVVSWKSGVNPVGAPAFSANGALYVALGDGQPAAGSYTNAIVALDPATLTVKDWFTAPGASFATAPAVFAVSGREMVAAATKDGRVFLLDAASLGGADHKTAVAVSASTNASRTWSPAGIATWQDGSQTRWIVLPGMIGTKSNITALRISGSTLQQAWTAEIASPSAPLVVSDVVFAVDQGTTARSAVLHALNGTTGKELWNSGQTLRAASLTPIWSSNGQVYVATTDRVVSAFGYSQDRHP